MGYGLDAELVGDDLERLLERLNRWHLDFGTDADYRALIGDTGMTPALLARSLERWESAATATELLAVTTDPQVD